MVSKTGLNRSNNSCGPPTMKDRVPSMALGSPPDTGASSIPTPLWASCAAISREAVGSMELMSMNTLPGRMKEATPPAPSMTSFTWGSWAAW